VGYPVTLTKDDLLEALEQAAPEPDKPVDVAALGESVIKELNRRAGDPLLAAELPGTFLIKLSTYFIEKQEREARERQSATEERMLSAVEIIDHPGLSVERKQELIREQLQRIDAESEMLRLKLEELT
jgi:hypothetical protein